MRQTDTSVPTFTDNAPVFYHNRTDHWIGLTGLSAGRCQLKASTHVLCVDIGRIERQSAVPILHFFSVFIAGYPDYFGSFVN
jgi:hypothetical protein